ncbi:MAG: protein kinase [Sandaracinaceae bacterium]
MSRAARRRAARALASGTIVAGRYRLDQKLGEGGMAEVFSADDMSSGEGGAPLRRVAVKVLHADIAAKPEAVERTKREGKVLSELDNPAIVSVESWGLLDDGAVFLVMELLEGETLGTRMRRGTIEPTELAPIVAGTCAGLHAAHSRGIVHRDLKPDNIFLCPTEHGVQVKLLDFGISKVYGSEKLTQTGEILGTPRYMSSEQLGAEPDIDGRVDVYALGVILYEALAGRPPFLTSTPTDLIIAILNAQVVPLRSARPDVPEGVEAVVMRAMSRTRTARYDTAMQLAEAYIDAVGGVAAVRSEQRRGLPTQAFGGMLVDPARPPSRAADTGVPITNPPPASDEAAKLPIGTFSGLGQAPLPRDQSELAYGVTAAMGAVAGAPVPPSPAPSGAGAAQPAKPKIPATRSPEEGRAVPATRETPFEVESLTVEPSRPARPIARTAMMDASQRASIPSGPVAQPSWDGASIPASAIPKKGGRTLLVLGALLAGALSAALVIGGLYLYEKSADEEPAVEAPAEEIAPSEAVVPAEPSSTAGEVAPVDDDDAPAPEGGDPAAPAAQEEVEAEPAARRSAPRRSRRASRERPAEAEAEPDAPPSGGNTVGDFLPGFRETQERETPPAEEVPAPPSSPADALRQARTAMRGGEPQRCVQILDDAIRGGAPAIALRRRGDCYDAAGQRDLAVRDYQRFCRLVPDHPAIGEVRARLDSWGRTCP